MKFYIPLNNSAKQEDFYEGVRKFCEETLSNWRFTDRRIFSVRYRHNGVEAIVQVGERETDGETVLAIFESESYVVCTANRGGLRGEPILIGKEAASSVEFFED